MTRKQNAQDRNEFQIYQQQARYYREHFEPEKHSPVWFIVGILVAVAIFGIVKQGLGL